MVAFCSFGLPWKDNSLARYLETARTEPCRTLAQGIRQKTLGFLGGGLGGFTRKPFYNPVRLLIQLPWRVFKTPSKTPQNPFQGFEGFSLSLVV